MAARTAYPAKVNKMQHVIEHFKNAMRDAGINPPETIIGDDNLHRFKIDGKLNGAYVLHLDGRAAGYFQDFKQGIKQNWKLEGNFKPLTDEERRAFVIEHQRQESERKAEEAAKHKATANKALYIWKQTQPAPDNQPYLIRKQVKPHIARLGRDNTLIIPILNANKELVNLQFIGADGTKRFLSGGKKKGCFNWLGEESDKILICEGFATAASVYESTGLITVIAFDAGNLKDVAITIRAFFPDEEIIIMADNDESGVGQAKARAAALEVHGKYTMPPTLGDFNDYLAGSV